MILVDTSVWIDFFRGIDAREANWLAAALEADEDLAICGPVLMEIRQGIVLERDLKNVQRRLAPLVYLPTPRKTYCHAADIFRAARKRGKTIRKPIDCLIAACAVEARAGLLDRDRDFETIAGIVRLDRVTSRID
jgi:predicted nucleic acid-binding protein